MMSFVWLLRFSCMKNVYDLIISLIHTENEREKIACDFRVCIRARATKDQVPRTIIAYAPTLFTVADWET